jgi:hypothetical protein
MFPPLTFFKYTYMHQANLSAARVFLAASTKFNVLEEALVSALQHMKDHKNASIQEALVAGLMDWDVPGLIDQWEQEQRMTEDTLPF